MLSAGSETWPSKDRCATRVMPRAAMMASKPSRRRAEENYSDHDRTGDIDAGGRRLCRLEQRQLHPEGRALAGDGGHADAPAHKLRQALRDRQAQSCAAVLARGGDVGLFEGFEQAALLFGREFNPGVVDFEPDGIAAQGPELQCHTPGLGELDAVAHEIDQRLADARGIAQYTLRQPRVHDHRQGDAFVFGAMTDQLARTLGHVNQ